MERRTSRIRLVLFTAISFALCFLLFEGLASTALLTVDLLQTSSARTVEAVHARYDPELGWINLPNLYIKDMYGPAVYFRTNSRGFRSNVEFKDAAPEDRFRVVCSGDSMTLGFGVDNDHNWCQLLQTLNPQLQAVNMGQSGYGADQAYLLYRREAAKLEHDVHIFAMIGDDFERMQKTRFLGYGRPVLKIANDRLVPDNIPVPKTSRVMRWIALNRPLFEKVRVVQLLARVTGQQHRLWSADQNLKRPLVATEEKKTILTEILEDLQQINAAKHSRLLVVYLPVRTEYSERADYSQLPGPPPGLAWQKFLAEQTAKLGIPFLSLVDDIQALPERIVDRLFIPYGNYPFRAQPGHYTREGNRFVAEAVQRKLKEMLPAALPDRDRLQVLRSTAAP